MTKMIRKKVPVTVTFGGTAKGQKWEGDGELVVQENKTAYVGNFQYHVEAWGGKLVSTPGVMSANSLEGAAEYAYDQVMNGSSVGYNPQSDRHFHGGSALPDGSGENLVEGWPLPPGVIPDHPNNHYAL